MFNKVLVVTKCSTNKGVTAKLKRYSPLVGRCSSTGLHSATPYLCYTRPLEVICITSIRVPPSVKNTNYFTSFTFMRKW